MNRPDPEALLLAAAKEGKGHLKVFLGAAPGVGKTWEMLAAARRARDEGRDVLIGVVETHGRAGTQSMIGDLPLLPRKRIDHRGQGFEEFDIDAALARRPGLLLVDELAHTNVPGSRHAKRWEDVAELLEHGIDVWATLNIQHLESLNDDIARITGVRVAETLPDRVLEMADAIEFIDLPPAELRARLRQGLIYPAPTASRALDNFFREGNLAALREIGLRRAAQRVDQDVRDYMRSHAVAGPWPAAERVLALVGNDAAAGTVVRRAKRLADALRAPWIALYVERAGTPESPRAALDLAAQLGAAIEIRAGGDLVGTAVALARERNVTHILIGRSGRSRLRRLMGRTLAAALLRQAPDFALHIAPAGGGRVSRPGARALRPGLVPWAGSTVLVAIVVASGELFSRVLQHEALGMMFLAAVVGAATLWGLAIAIYAAAISFLCWNFFFIPPIYQLTIGEPRDVVAILVFLAVAVATGWLASRVRREADAAQGRIATLRRISAFSRRLGAPATEAELLPEIAALAADVAAPSVVMTEADGDIDIRAAVPASLDTMDEGSWAAARWAHAKQEAAGRGTATLPSSAWRFVPMQTVRGHFGIIGVRPDAPLDAGAVQTLQALADQAATAVERVRLATDAARSAAQQETQKLRVALLNSLSHDLRTPLAGIRAAASALRGAWNELAADARRDLLVSIEQDTVRMTRFLANILDMTRIETGEVTPRIERVALAPAVEAAVARVPGLGQVALDLPDDLPAALADPALLEQVLVNLLENAAKYGPEGGIVRVSARICPEGLRLAIADEGPGIPPDDLPHVFDSFFRARRGDRVVPGTGLGLAIAHGLMEAMGGAIAARSPRPDAPRDGAPGTDLELTLPAASRPAA